MFCIVIAAGENIFRQEIIWEIPVNKWRNNALCCLTNHRSRRNICQTYHYRTSNARITQGVISVIQSSQSVFIFYYYGWLSFCHHQNVQLIHIAQFRHINTLQLLSSYHENVHLLWQKYQPVFLNPSLVVAPIWVRFICVAHTFLGAVTYEENMYINQQEAQSFCD